ncbi:2,3-bisphosphoglycerate-independent phosphoglycerate mutase [Thioalkalivibrio sulfidiphilus]|uniref:2,3-bisphosphoglycerate-independent phosphoglycerate mutase n=1 Tax=Thioalkalivibrio sulfidiphilus (strain HL-EbGR7) TaxID=396588 RepID=B8GU38_THISH|nr:2,3-bisphosphoglycerate-independent phosphoglycerate mutase [Thioalkalivibrio sulfidiphilus]ACL71321.1 phosphoglycerate mutase, 2,3-bisphosphoglycerate-independent [Thioalkalivibrio sulfidiphilus HL-EbGr7]
MSEDHKTPRCPTLLVIMDGVGINPSKINNAVAEARTPRLDEYFSTHVHTTLDACGRAVGLPDGQMGNSEVGHLTLGCGSVVRQDLVRIDDAIADGSFFENSALNGAAQAAKAADRPLHLLGLVSDGGVHSHVRHLQALIQLCQRLEVKPLVHMITDGRDTAPKCAANYLDELEPLLAEAGGRIATVSGRYYAMDRDKRWDRTKKAFDALVHGDGERAASAAAAIESAYAAGETDEFIKPRVIDPEGMLRPGDALVFFNFRNDRPRQMAAALGMDEFDGFDRGDFKPVSVTCLTEYDPRFLSPIGFPPERPSITLGEVISTAGIRQFHCAETEKYAHVTFFFNGGKEEPFAGEDRVMVPSPPVATYDEQPEMSASEVADETIKAIESGQYGFIVVNFANGDMVGHTAVREAVIKAVEALDAQVGRVLDAAKAKGFSVLLTADHGNCDEMVDPVTGEPHTQHTMYPVPLLLIDRERWRLTTGGGLSGIAPTVLQLMGLPQPKAMRSKSLLLSGTAPAG